MSAPRALWTTWRSGHPSDLMLRAGLLCRQYPEGMHVSTQGFVDNMEEWMAACDIVITKAGPGTIAESLIMGLPILLNGFVPCQEAGNVPYVVNNGVRPHPNPGPWTPKARSRNINHTTASASKLWIRTFILTP